LEGPPVETQGGGGAANVLTGVPFDRIKFLGGGGGYGRNRVAPRAALSWRRRRGASRVRSRRRTTTRRRFLPALPLELLATVKGGGVKGRGRGEAQGGTRGSKIWGGGASDYEGYGGRVNFRVDRSFRLTERRTLVCVSIEMRLAVKRFESCSARENAFLSFFKYTRKALSSVLSLVHKCSSG
jgi:hypothetical protein